MPGLVLQLVTLMRAKEETTGAAISLLTSVGSTAMTATILFYDVETDPGARKRNLYSERASERACEREKRAHTQTPY